MKKKITTTHKPINKTKNNDQKQSSNNILINPEFFIIFKKFYDSSSKYIQSIRTCLKEININIFNNKSIPLDDSSNKCISSLNIIFNYLDSSFNQFYSNIHKYFDQANLNKYLKIQNNSKKPNVSKSISSYFYNDNNYKPNSIYNNYQFNKLSKNNLYRNKKMNKMNTTTEIKKTDKYNSIIEEKIGHSQMNSELTSKSNNNIFEDNNKTFIESIKNLLNVLKYEKINNVGNPRKTQYQQKLNKFKENLICELSNSLNDKNKNDATHRRIRSVNLNSNTFNHINNVNENDINKNQINELIIQENDENYFNDLNNEIFKDINNKNKEGKNKDSFYFFEKNEKCDILNNIDNNIVDNMSINNINNYKEKEVQIENTKLKNENDILEKNKKELHIQIADLINNNNSLNEEISKLKNSNLINLEKEKKTKEIINELNKKIESITNIKSELEKKKQILVKSIETYENKNISQLKEIKQLKDEIEELKLENQNLNKKLNNIEEEKKVNIKTISDLKQEIDDLNKEIGELVKDNEKMNNEIEDKNNIKEEYNEKYEKAIKELNDEKQINSIMEKKIKNLETKLDEHNINEYDETKTKTYKLSNINKVNEIEVEQLSRKYVSPYNYRKNTSVLSTNNTSNNRKIIINNNLDELEISPDNYIIVKSFQLNNNLKWYLLKKKKKNIEHDPSPTPSPNQSNSKHIFRRFKYLKTNSKINNEKNESFSDFIWKPNKNEKDFINFNYLNNENDNNKNDNSTSKDWQKKINELEYCIKDLEEKLEKKENDCNRINLNYAKLFKRSKQPELNYDKVLENNEKLKSENRILKKKIENLKSSQNFIALSFIADDLEGSRFIDDNCFEELLDGLDGGFKKNNTYKRSKEDNKFEINIMKLFRSHGDDNDNKEINEENNNIKKDLNDINDNIKQRTVKAKEKRIHLLDINEENEKNENNIQIIDKNFNKDYNKLRTFKRQNKNYFENNFDNSNKNDINIDKNENKNNEKKNEIQLSDNKNNSHKKYLSYRYSRYRHYADKNKNDINENNNNVNNKNDNIDKNEKKDNHEIKTVMNNNNNLFKNDYDNKKQNLIEKINNGDQINKETKIDINKVNDDKLNKKSENENDNKKITNQIYKDNRGYVKKYRKNKEINNNNNNEIDLNKDKNNKDLEEKKIENIPLKMEEKKENKPYRSLKSMKLNNEIKFDKVLQESSSQTNRVCRGRRFYKRKQEDINTEIKE